MDFPEPVIKVSIEPKTKADLDKMGMGLNKLAAEDPSFTYARDDQTGQTVIAGMGELHLEIIVDRLKREFKVECNVGEPQVNYREAISKTHEALHAQEAERRKRTVRGHQGSLRAARAWHGLRVRLGHQGWCCAEGVHPRRGEGTRVLHGLWPNCRVPRLRHARDAVRRKLPRRRL